MKIPTALTTGILLIAATALSHATLTFNNGTVNTVNSAQSTDGSVPVIDVLTGTTVNWDAGASLTVNVTAGGNTIGMIRLADTSAFNLNGGGIIAAQTVSGRLSSLYLLGTYTGTSTFSSGSISNTRTIAGTTAAAGTMRTFEATAGTPGGIVNVSGGTYSTSEAFSGDTELVRSGNGVTTTFNLSGGNFNLTESGGGVLTMLRLQGATVNMSGGNYNLSSDGGISLFSLETSGASLTISGGTITANQNLTGTVTDGHLVLNGTFTGLPNGVYSTNDWVNGAVTGTLVDGSPFNLSTLTLSGAGTITIQYIPNLSQALTWVGGTGGNAWDVATTANWTNVLDGGGLATFANGDSVVFDDTSANTTVNLSGTLQPTTLTVTNTVNNYTFSGGTIGGAAQLIKLGTGTLTLSSVNTTNTGGTTVEAGTLVVSSASDVSLAGLAGAGALTKQGGGKLTISGANTLTGQVSVQGGTLAVLTTASGASYSVSAGSTLQVTDGGGSTTLGADSLSFASGSTILSLNDGVISSAVPLINAPNFTNAGTVTVSYTATTITPGAIVLINYDAASSAVGSFTLAALPLGYSGSLVTNVANSSIDLVITGLPAKVWAGGNSSSPGYSENLWDIATTANWNAGAATFVDGDIVQFDDSGSYTDPINVAGFPVAPGLMYVTNSSKTYSFQSGTISTPLLVKEGSGTMSLQVAGNAFTGVDLREGTLSYDTTATAAGAFTGDGTLRVGSGAIVTLNGNLAGFDGPITAVSGGTLKPGANNVLGTTNGATTIANGATLDVNGTQNQTEEIIVSGAGTDFFSGAIINSGANQQNALGSVTLTGNTTFGGVGRWDIRSSTTNNATLKLTGAYTLAKEGANTVGLVNVDVDPQLGDINVNGGTFQIEGRTSEALGNVNNTINLNFGTTLGLFNNTAGLLPAWNKKIVLNGDAAISKAGAQSAALVGTVNLNSSTLTFNCTAGSLFMSNVISGSSANVIKIGGSPVTLLGANTYNGLTTVSNGTLTVGSLHTGNGDFVVRPAATLGAVVRQAGTSLTMPKLVLGNELAVDPGVVNVTFDLGAFGNPAAPVINVTGAGLFLPYCASNRFNLLADLNLLSAGSIVLLDYTGSPVTNNIVLGTLPAGVAATLTHDTANTRFLLTITSVARNLDWVGNVNSDWNIATTANWVGTGTTNATTYKEIGVGDNVFFKDAASNFVVNVTTTVIPNQMEFSGTNNYSVGGPGSISGPVQVRVVVDPAATVTLTGNNSYTGGTFFDNGTTIVGGDAALGAANGQMLWSGGAVRFTGSATNSRLLGLRNSGNDCVIIVDTNQLLQLNGACTNSNNEELRKAGPGGLELTGSGALRLFVTEGTATLAGNASMTNGTSFQNISGTNGIAKLVVKDNAFLENTSASGLNIADGNGQTNSTILGEMQVQGSAVLSLASLNVGKFLTATGRVYQTGGLVKTNATGTWWLGGSGAADTNTFGGYYLSGGTLAIPGRDMQVGRNGLGELVVSGTGTMQAQSITVGAESTARGSVLVNGGSVTLGGTLSAPLRGKTGSLVVSNGGTVTASALVLGSTNDVNSGTVVVGPNGTLTVGQISGLATTTAITFNGGTVKAGASSATFLQGLTSATLGAGGLTVDTDGKNITIGQNLQGAGALTKTGAGTLTMTTPLSAYTGLTLVNGGTLDAQGSFSGSVTVGASGTITPSTGVIWQVQVLGNLTLGGTTVMEIGKLALPSSDSFVSGGTLTLGGTLVVTNVGPSALAVGNSFTLFSGALSGNFASVELPAVDPVSGLNITWNNTLATDGKITVAALGPTIVLDPAPSLTNVVSGGQVQLSWGSEYAGYTLQRQTNSLAVGLSTNWVDLTGTESVTATNYPVNVTVPVEFYRLRYLVP